jgi:hypothetical protein
VRQRWYDADVGSWLTRDPSDCADPYNLYEYVLDAPLTQVDPSGLFAQFVDASTASLWNTANDIELSSTSMIGDSITEAIQKCMEQPTMCARYQCFEQMYDTFNELCGGCLEEYLRHIRTVIDLWCNHGDLKKLKDGFCEAQHELMKPICDKCGNCKRSSRGTPTEEECNKWTKTALCYGTCIGWYKWFDAMCSKGKDGKPNPKRHEIKINDWQNALKTCGKSLSRCGRGSAGTN